MQRHLIQSDPAIMMGKPVIAGTRITVELILEKLAAGESIKQITEEHPRLSEEKIHAALAFASDALRADAVYPITRRRSEIPCCYECVDRQIIDRIRQGGYTALGEKATSNINHNGGRLWNYMMQ